MKLSPFFVGSCALLLVGACASSPDHFYTLNTLPDAARPPLSAPLVHVRLDVTVPALVDRSEMIVATPGGVEILDHERWAVTFSDQVAQTLSRDIERRRADVMVGDRRFDQGAGSTQVKVDIVQMTVQRGGRARLEAHWRIVDVTAGIDELGGGSLETPVQSDAYAAVARAYSELLSELADRLAQRLPAASQTPPASQSK